MKGDEIDTGESGRRSPHVEGGDEMKIPLIRGPKSSGKSYLSIINDDFETLFTYASSDMEEETDG